MPDQYTFSIDPGKSSGLALGVVPEGEPYRLVNAYQVEGGVVGLTEWLSPKIERIGGLASGLGLNGHRVEGRFFVVCEKFTPLQNKGYAQTLDSTEPLRCEGALIAMGVMPDYPTPEWRRPQSMYLFGGKDLKTKKARGREFLKDNDMYVTGKTVGCKDADDARSAIWHGISYAAQVLKSKETFQQIADWSKQKGA